MGVSGEAQRAIEHLKVAGAQKVGGLPKVCTQFGREGSWQSALVVHSLLQTQWIMIGPLEQHSQVRPEGQAPIPISPQSGPSAVNGASAVTGASSVLPPSKSP